MNLKKLIFIVPLVTILSISSVSAMFKTQKSKSQLEEEYWNAIISDSRFDNFTTTEKKALVEKCVESEFNPKINIYNKNEFKQNKL